MQLNEIGSVEFWLPAKKERKRKKKKGRQKRNSEYCRSVNGLLYQDLVKWSD